MDIVWTVHLGKHTWFSFSLYSSNLIPITKCSASFVAGWRQSKQKFMALYGASEMSSKVLIHLRGLPFWYLDSLIFFFLHGIWMWWLALLHPSPSLKMKPMLWIARQKGRSVLDPWGHYGAAYQHCEAYFRLLFFHESKILLYKKLLLSAKHIS